VAPGEQANEEDSVTENPETYLRAVRRRRRVRAPDAEPKQPAKTAPLITQGARSAPPRPTPPSVDEVIRDAIASRRGQGLWTPLG
jgi:hypothetical protein